MGLVSICCSVILLSTVLAIHEIPELQGINLYLSSSSNETWIFFVQGRPLKSLESVEGSTFPVVCSPSSLSGCQMFGCPDTA